MTRFKNKRNRTLLMSICDAIIVVSSAFLAIALRFDISHIPRVPLENALRLCPLYIGFTIAVMWIFKLYNRIWSYASSKELFDILKVSLIIEALIVASHMLLGRQMPRSFYPIQFLVMTVMFLLMRFYVVITNAVKGTYRKERIDRRIMLIGAGSAADIIIKELKKEGSHAQIVCAIDDNENKHNQFINGVPIVGGRNDIGNYIAPYDVNEIII